MVEIFEVAERWVVVNVWVGVSIRKRNTGQRDRIHVAHSPGLMIVLGILDLAIKQRISFLRDLWCIP